MLPEFHTTQEKNMDSGNYYKKMYNQKLQKILAFNYLITFNNNNKLRSSMMNKKIKIEKLSKLNCWKNHRQNKEVAITSNNQKRSFGILNYNGTFIGGSVQYLINKTF